MNGKGLLGIAAVGCVATIARAGSPQWRGGPERTGAATDGLNLNATASAATALALAGHLHAGPATYEALSDRLGDASLSRADAETAGRRDGLLHPAIWDLATQRHYASEFLARAAVVFPPAAEELKAASGLFKAIHDAVGQINKVGGGKQPGSPLPKTGVCDIKAIQVFSVERCSPADDARIVRDACVARWPTPPARRASGKPSPWKEQTTTENTRNTKRQNDLASCASTPNWCKHSIL